MGLAPPHTPDRAPSAARPPPSRAAASLCWGDVGDEPWGLAPPVVSPSVCPGPLVVRYHRRMDLGARFRTRAWRTGGIALALAAVTLSVVGWRSLRRRSAVHARGAGAPDQTASAESRPVSEWTDRFAALLAAGDWETLDADLEGIRESESDLYAWYRLEYLHGRVKLARGEPAEARRMFEPFLAAGQP